MFSLIAWPYSCNCSSFYSIQHSLFLFMTIRYRHFAQVLTLSAMYSIPLVFIPSSILYYVSNVYYILSVYFLVTYPRGVCQHNALFYVELLKSDENVKKTYHIRESSKLQLQTYAPLEFCSRNLNGKKYTTKNSTELILVTN